MYKLVWPLLDVKLVELIVHPPIVPPLAVILPALSTPKFPALINKSVPVHLKYLPFAVFNIDILNPSFGTTPEYPKNIP